MKPSAFEKIYSVGLSVTAAPFLGGPIVLMGLPAAKADIYRADYVTAKRPNEGEDIYLPSRLSTKNGTPLKWRFPRSFRNEARVMVQPVAHWQPLNPLQGPPRSVVPTRP